MYSTYIDYMYILIYNTYMIRHNSGVSRIVGSSLESISIVERKLICTAIYMRVSYLVSELVPLLLYLCMYIYACNAYTYG